jgi:hypothetical protein
MRYSDRRARHEVAELNPERNPQAMSPVRRVYSDCHSSTHAPTNHMAKTTMALTTSLIIAGICSEWPFGAAQATGR